MILLLWILLILFSLILVMTISIAVYHPKPVEKKQAAAETAPATEEEAPVIDYTKAGRRMADDLFIRYPDFKLYMETKYFDHCVLMHWKGNAKGNRTVLISIRNESCRNACTEAVQRIYESQRIPSCSFYLIFPYTAKVEQEACRESREYLRNQGIHVSGVLMDGSDNEYLLHQARPQALIGICTGTYMKLKVNGNTRKTSSWIDALDPNTVLSLHHNAFLHRIAVSLADQIPWMIRLELLWMPMKGMTDLLAMMPAAWIWMRASIEKTKAGIILRAPDVQMCQNAYKALEEEASKNSFYLNVEETIQPTAPVGTDAWIYQRISSCVQQCFELKGVVPVPVAQTGNLGSYDGWQTCRYMPLTENKKESPESAVLFYDAFLMKA